MKQAPHTPRATSISHDGVWLQVDGSNYFLSFREFPWFERATEQQIRQVERSGHSDHLHWPLLDVDLSVPSIIDPTSFPLLSRSFLTTSHINA